jgi:hypothetical protein
VACLEHATIEQLPPDSIEYKKWKASQDGGAEALEKLTIEQVCCIVGVLQYEQLSQSVKLFRGAIMVWERARYTKENHMLFTT